MRKAIGGKSSWRSEWRLAIRGGGSQRDMVVITKAINITGHSLAIPRRESPGLCMSFRPQK
jgi:hypothetical protein